MLFDKQISVWYCFLLLPKHVDDLEVAVTQDKNQESIKNNGSSAQLLLIRVFSDALVAFSLY